MGTGRLIAGTVATLLIGALAGCSGGGSAAAGPPPGAAGAPSATAEGGAATPSGPGDAAVTTAVAPAVPPPTALGELVRVVVPPAGRTVTTTRGGPPVPGAEYVIRGRCDAASPGATLPYAVVDGAAQVITAGEIPCNSGHETVDTAVPAGVSVQRISIVLHPDLARVMRAFAVIVPASQEQ